MRNLRAWLLRVADVFHKEQKEQELTEEMRSHLQMHIDDDLRAGMSIEQARRDAQIKLGGVEATKELYRERRGLPNRSDGCRDARDGDHRFHRDYPHHGRADGGVWLRCSGAVFRRSLRRSRRRRRTAHTGDWRPLGFGRRTARRNEIGFGTSGEARGNRLGHRSAHCVCREPRDEQLDIRYCEHQSPSSRRLHPPSAPRSSRRRVHPRASRHARRSFGRPTPRVVLLKATMVRAAARDRGAARSSARQPRDSLRAHTYTRAVRASDCSFAVPSVPPASTTCSWPPRCHGTALL